MRDIRLLLVASILFSSGCLIRASRPVATATLVAPAPPVATVVAPAPPPTVVATGPAVSSLLVPGSAANGFVSYPNHQVYFSLNVSYPQTIVIYVSGHGLDPTVRVSDSYGNQLGYDDDGGSGTDSQLVLTVAPGIYNIQVAGYGSSTGAFTLTVN